MVSCVIWESYQIVKQRRSCYGVVKMCHFDQSLLKGGNVKNERVLISFYAIQDFEISMQILL